MQNSKEHIRHCLLYEYQLGHSVTEATRNICQTVGQDSTTLRTALNWFDRFRNQDYSLQDMARSGRPTTIIIIGRIEAAIREGPIVNHHRCSK